MRVEDRARTAPDLVSGKRQHQATGRRVTRQRRHGEPVSGGQDCLHQVIDGVDVPPGLFRRIIGGLDYIQIDAVGEQVPWPAEHDHPHRAVLRGPVRGEQPAAVAGAHSAAREGELQIPHASGFAVADLLVRAPARRHHQRRGDFGHTSQ
jgi:hypothetical protein